MHRGDDDVGREDAEAAFRMDLAVHGGRNHRRIPEGQFAQGAAAVEDGAAALAPEIEHRQVSPALGVDMAVHALVLRVPPVGDGLGVEAFQMPFHDLQVVPDFEAGLDEAVGQESIDRIPAHMDGPAEGLRPRRRPVLGKDLHVRSRRQHPGPCLFLPDHIPAPDLHGGSGRCEGGHEAGGVRIRVVEVERGDVAGNGDVPVVRENGCRAVGSRPDGTQFRRPPARKEQEERRQCHPGTVNDSRSAQHSRNNTNRFSRIPPSGSSPTRCPACRWSRSGRNGKASPAKSGSG